MVASSLADCWYVVRCRDTIDNFLEMLPLFQALAHKAMRDRHWRALMQITGLCTDMTATALPTAVLSYSTTLVMLAST
jgi:hypothetical protein